MEVKEIVIGAEKSRVQPVRRRCFLEMLLLLLLLQLLWRRRRRRRLVLVGEMIEGEVLREVIVMKRHRFGGSFLLYLIFFFSNFPVCERER